MMGCFEELFQAVEIMGKKIRWRLSKILERGKRNRSN